MCVYLIIDMTNGYGYVGKTIKTAKKRWKEHVRLSRNVSHRNAHVPLACAIRAHGEENFEVSVLEEVAVKENLSERETWWIEHMNTVNPEKGYNVYSRVEGCDRGRWLSRVAKPRKPKHRYFGVKPMGKAFRMHIAHGSERIVRHFDNETEAAEIYDKLSVWFNGRGVTNVNFPSRVDHYTAGELEECFSLYIERDKASPYRGVTKVRDKWRMSTRFGYRSVSTRGIFDTDRQAAEAFDRINLRLRGPDAILNFPENRQAYLAENLEAYHAWATARRPKSSSHRGVSFDSWGGKWHAKYRGKKVGAYWSEEEAAQALRIYIRNQTKSKTCQPSIAAKVTA